VDEWKCDLCGTVNTGMECFSGKCITIAQKAHPAYSDIEAELRKEWWLNHGCDASLYGDDGEMQCACGDYRREPLDVLRARTQIKRVMKAQGLGGPR
jgi:hypothetical protein